MPIRIAGQPEIASKRHAIVLSRSILDALQTVHSTEESFNRISEVLEKMTTVKKMDNGDDAFHE